MALPANIPITYGLFQQGVLYSQTAGPLIAATDAALNMSFINDGYTILIVQNLAAAVTTVTVYGVPDNAGRSVGVNFAQTVPGVTLNPTVGGIGIFGPYRPIWWNQAGVVNVTFSAITTVTVKAVSLQF